MQVKALGYVAIETSDLDAWRRFGTEVLGTMLAPDLPGDGSLWFKLDERAFRLQIAPGQRDRLVCAGWELADGAAFEAAERELEAAGVAFKRASAAEAAARRVTALLRLDDPCGAGIELFHTPILEHSRFVSPVGVSGFVTGDLGLGHVVLPAAAFDAADAFYTRLLGFRLSDRMRMGDGDDAPRIQFYHCNPRHHSLALIEGEHPAGLIHIMLEVPSLDEVGYALDRCEAHGVPISATLGRHVNDQMVSFYMQSPSVFDVEFGFGGRRVEPGNVIASEITAVSYWGHRFRAPDA